jgi:hypothetical protein
VVHRSSGILFKDKKDEILSFAIPWKGTGNHYVSEVSKAQKDAYHIIAFICEKFKTSNS